MGKDFRPRLSGDRSVWVRIIDKVCELGLAVAEDTLFGRKGGTDGRPLQ